jgi:hypothetical protein
MKTLTLLTVAILSLGLGTAQAEVSKYTPEQIKEMPRFSSIEQRRCSKAHYSTVKERLECKKEVRVKIFEKRQVRNKAKE